MLGLTRGVRRQLPTEVLDRVPEHASPGASTIVTAPPRCRARPRSSGRRASTAGRAAANGYPASHADTIVGHELIPAGDLIGRDLAHRRVRRATTRTDDEGPRRRRAPQSYWWSVLLAVVFLLGLGLWWFNAGPGAYTEVPAVADKPAAAAESTLAAAGFTVGNDTAYDDTVAKGNVIETRPRGGADARKGSRVTMVVSLGRETAVVPERGEEVGGRRDGGPEERRLHRRRDDAEVQRLGRQGPGHRYRPEGEDRGPDRLRRSR